MNSIDFFNNNKKISLKKLFPKIKLKKDYIILNIRTLEKSTKKDISFFDSIKYKKDAEKTKAICCITNDKLSKFLPQSCEKIVVTNVLFELAKTLKILYPLADIDYLDPNLKKPNISKFSKVKFGNNVLLGKNVKIGKNTQIGNNVVIETNVIIGNNCTLGSNLHVKNTIIGDNVVIQSGCNIGLKGFGFIPLKNKNLKMPHIGKVVINDNVEIASGCTIDRGSVDDTIIGKNTYLDNQVHVAHNVKIGDNCMIAGQVGFAGSSTIGNNVSIGGQAGVSGHLKVGDNVKIGGGSGVIKNIEDNAIVMGYPAIPFKDFIKNWKK